MQRLPEKLARRLEHRREGKNLRTLNPHRAEIDFCSNDYLGFARSSELQKQIESTLNRGSISSLGSTGSRLLSGNHELYGWIEDLLEKELCVSGALVFNSGYAANLGLFSSVPQKGDFVFYDEYIHASIRDGLGLCLAKSFKFKHNDIEDLKHKVNRILESGKRSAEVYIITESVFSMEGDTPPLKNLATYCRENGFRLIVDEAHAYGILGPQGKGLIPELNLENEVFARIITFGKAIGCHGAAVIGDLSLKKYLINFARSFIYTTALDPHSLRVINGGITLGFSDYGTEQRKLLSERIVQFKTLLKQAGLEPYFLHSNTPIQSCLIPGNEQASRNATILQQAGYDIRPVLAPTVPVGKERLRICIHSFNTAEQITNVLSILKAEIFTVDGRKI